MARAIVEGIDFEDASVVDSLDVTYENVQKELALFMQEKIADMRSYTDQLNRKDLPPQGLIERQLMQYPHIMWALILLHGQARVEMNTAKAMYDFKYSELYAKTKQDEMSKGKAGFTQTKDLENLTKSTYAKELGELNAQLILADNKYNFANYLVDAWKEHQFTLGNLTKLTLNDKNASDIEYRHAMERLDDE